MIKSFLFDIGNVLVNFDLSRSARKYVERSALTLSDVEGTLRPIHLAYEGGALDDGEFVSSAIQALGYQGEPGEFETAWCDIFTAQHDMWRLVRRLHEKGYGLFLLSNTSGLHLQYLRDTFEIFECFQGGVYSHLAKSMKPDDGIYREVIRSLGLDPAETVYIDDMEANVIAGDKHGFRSYWHRDNDVAAFEEWLGRFGLI